MTEVQALRELAHLFDVQTAYYDVSHKRRNASPESLFLVLQQLGAQLERISDAPSALEAEKERVSQRDCPPVHVVGQGKPSVIRVRTPRNGFSKLHCHLTFEDGRTRGWTLHPHGAPAYPPTNRYAAGGAIDVALPEPIPYGYHRLRLDSGKFACESLVLSAPPKAFQSPEKSWGIFVPPYALHSEASLGAGSFSDLETLASWLQGLGGRVLATLPMLAAFLDQPFDHSPYSPASRLFWNEFYIDVTQAPGFASCISEGLWKAKDVQSEIAALEASQKVDYGRVMRLKRRLLEPLAKHFFKTGPAEREKFESYVRDHPEVVDYAEFRAIHDRRATSWRNWPERLRGCELRESDYDADSKRYHLYAQWLAHEQVHHLGRKIHESGVKLYLDLPLGVHPDGYDVWRHRDLFLAGLSAGAPPDTVFTRGQNWGFPPLHPRSLRRQAYDHFVRVLRHHLRTAGILRIDHVMALHRLFCIPKGLEAKDGVYLRYPSDELYAILAIESHRYEATIVGENLGTVPGYVNTSMSQRGLDRMYVMQYELGSDPARVFPPVPRNSVASINTHDMPPFASYWAGLDIEGRRELGLLDDADATCEKDERRKVCNAAVNFLTKERWLESRTAQNMRSILEACLAFLSAGPARRVLVSVEDLWLETNPQNFPGTGPERPNWQRKLRYTYEQFSCMPRVLGCLERLDSLRKNGETADA